MYKYIYAALFVLVTWGTATMAQTAKADEFEYHPRFGAIRLDSDVKAAMKKFPELSSCLKSDSSKDSKVDLDAIDWDKIRNDGDAKVCLFMIFEQLGGPEEVKKWLANQGFSVWGPFNQGRDHIVLRRFGYDVSHAALENYKILGVDGGWSLEGQYPKFPTSGFTPYFRRALSRAQNIGDLLP